MAFPFINLALYSLEIAIYSIMWFYPTRPVIHAWAWFTQMGSLVLTMVGLHSSNNYDFIKLIEEHPRLVPFRNLIVEMAWIRLIPYMVIFFFVLVLVIVLIWVGF